MTAERPIGEFAKHEIPVGSVWGDADYAFGIIWNATHNFPTETF